MGFIIGYVIFLSGKTSSEKVFVASLGHHGVLHLNLSGAIIFV